MYSVLIVVLIVAQTVQSAVLLYYCTFENGGRCDANIVVNQTERVLRFDDVDDLHINLTCVSNQAIRWVLQVPTVSTLKFISLVDYR